jgi:hypothetical protein
MRFVFLLAGVFFGILLAGLLVALLARLPGWRARTPALSRYLLASAVASALIAGVVGLPLLIEDRAGPAGIAATVVPPVVLSLIALAAGIADRRFTPVVLWLVAFLGLAYVVVYGLGLGFFYLPTVVLLVVAAVVRTVRVRPLVDGGGR